MNSNPNQKVKSAVHFDLNIPSPSDGGSEETLIVNQKQLERFTSSIKERKRNLSKVEEILAEWKLAVIEEVGETNWKKFLEFSKNQRKTNFGLEEITFDPDGLEKLDQAKRFAREKSQDLFKEANFEPGSLKTIHRRYTKQLDDLLKPEKPKVQRLEMVPENQIPEDVFSGKSNPWTIRTPPYDGWAWSYSWTRVGGSDPGLTNYLNVATGSVGHRSNYQNYDAGDLDYLWLDFNTNIGVWYWPPHAGQVDIWIKARCVKSWYNVWLDDEWGWSDSDTWMRGHITVNVSPAIADREISEIWWSHTWGNPDSKTYGGEVIKSNDVKWFHLIATDPIPANAWTYIKVGTYDMHRSFLNDVSVNTTMRDWWYLEGLWIDVR